MKNQTTPIAATSGNTAQIIPTTGTPTIHSTRRGDITLIPRELCPQNCPDDTVFVWAEADEQWHLFVGINCPDWKLRAFCEIEGIAIDVLLLSIGANGGQS